MGAKIYSRMNRDVVTIVDYGMGNLWSVASALDCLGWESNITSDAEQVINADLMILPGVGSFRNAMNSIRARSLDDAIVDAVSNRGAKILGICLGMQLLGTSSTEDGYTEGLGLISSEVNKFIFCTEEQKKIPHMGFDEVVDHRGMRLFKGLDQKSDFYFVHSYRMMPPVDGGRAAMCNYGDSFMAAYEFNNIYATQFHPEKSQSNGLAVLRNFLTE